MKCVRLSYLALGLITLLFGVASVTSADLYTYRDAQGQYHFTNDASTIPVAYRQQAASAQRQPAGPLTLSTVPAAMANPAASYPSPVIQPVTTDQFQRLLRGVKSREVVHRLGEPSVKIVQADREIIETGPRGTPVKRLVRFETWYYPGAKHTLATRLIFHDGVLAQKFQ